MNDDVEAKLQRPLHDRRSEGVVGDRDQAVCVCRSPAMAARSAMRSSGLPGRLDPDQPVCGVIAASTAAASLASTWVIVRPAERSRTR